MSKRHLWTLAPLLALLLLLLSTTAAFGEGAAIRLVSSSVTSEFPEGIRFRAEVDGDNEITSVAVRFRIGQATRGVFDYLEFESGTLVDSELFWRTNSRAGYIPPGTMLTYNFEIEDEAGNRLDTEPLEFIYLDIRFDWQEVSEGPITVAYHGPVKQRAEIVRDAIIETLALIGPVLGADTEETIRVTMYNNVKEMLEGLPPGSTTIRRELITEGQAFVNIGTLLVLGGGRLARGTASHEVTHILIHRAGDSVFRTVPSWLSEGLAEYGNIAPGFSYDVALEFAVETGQLLPITSTRTIPATAEDVIIFYGEARSLVRFMIGVFGQAKMRELMATMKSGKSVDDAIEQVYGIDRVGLENLWRASIGAPPYEPVEAGRALPTRIPRPEVLPYSLTPQPQSATIGDSSAIATPEPTPTATLTPEPADTPTPEPTSTPEPVASPFPSPTAVAVAVSRESTASPAPEQPSESRGDEDQGRGGCSAPRHGGPAAMEVSTVALLVGLVGLGFRRRMSR